MVHLQNEYYSAVKNNKINKFARKWKELEKRILSEVTKKQKTKDSKYTCNLSYVNISY